VNTFLDAYLAHKNNMDQLTANLLRGFGNVVSSRKEGSEKLLGE
jgi:hypothetical protein